MPMPHNHQNQPSLHQLMIKRHRHLSPNLSSGIHDNHFHIAKPGDMLCASKDGQDNRPSRSDTRSTGPDLSPKETEIDGSPEPREMKDGLSTANPIQPGVEGT